MKTLEYHPGRDIEPTYRCEGLQQYILYIPYVLCRLIFYFEVELHQSWRCRFNISNCQLFQSQKHHSPNPSLTVHIKVPVILDE